MSDDDADFEDEDYEFDYEGSDDGDAEQGVDLENDYYTAKSQRDTPKIALASFQAIVDADKAKGEQSEYGFKALKQLCKLEFLKLKEYDKAFDNYTTLLTYIKKAVTRNVAEKSINNILDYVSHEKELDTVKMQKFYEVTMDALQEAKNERLSQKTNLKLAKLWLDRSEFTRLNAILKDLHASCAQPGAEDGVDSQFISEGEVAGSLGDSSKGTMQLEVFALEIQMYGMQGNNKKLREIYEKSLRVKSAISHPRIQGVIRECGGKMFMSEKEWSKAQVDFFESFKSYDEAGSSSERIQVLKYLVLAHMLMDSEINPFDSQETKPYRDHPDIKPMTDLVAAYQRRDVWEAEKILRDNRASIMDDPFIANYISSVLLSLRTQWILSILKPYTVVDLSYLAGQLKVPVDQVESIVVSLILDGKLRGQLNQLTGQLELEKHRALEVKRNEALASWSRTLKNLQGTVISKVVNQSAGTGPAQGMGDMGMAGMMGEMDWEPGMRGSELRGWS